MLRCSHRSIIKGVLCLFLPAEIHMYVYLNFTTRGAIERLEVSQYFFRKSFSHRLVDYKDYLYQR